jgi:2-polyprenyl-3-methyl-5-hydroxy-6-metoxy-1,4-benzoquinol methylase
MNDNFFIKSNYKVNKGQYFDDTSQKEEYQKEVYQYAKKLFNENNFKSVLDIGCGSGYKLIKNFNENITLGIDVPKTIEFLLEKYPNKNWTDSFSPVQGYDLIISSDVIEHIVDPNILLNLIKQCNPKLILLSTPDRNFLPVDCHNGPPQNQSHIREWSFQEFYEYINYHFEIVSHFISNKKQATQLIVAKIKK